MTTEQMIKWLEGIDQDYYPVQFVVAKLRAAEELATKVAYAGVEIGEKKAFMEKGDLGEILVALGAYEKAGEG